MTFTAAHLKRFKSALIHGLVALLFGLGTGQVMAADVNISDKPLDTLQGVPANILLTMDDSGSMEWNYAPDTIENDDNTKRAKASSFNRIYYNPAITYTPAKDEDGASLGNASFTAAWYNGFDQCSTTGCTRNLSTNYCALWEDTGNCARNSPSETDSGVAAFYYVFDPTNTNAAGGSCNPATDASDDACYDRVNITSGTTAYTGKSYSPKFRTDNDNSSGQPCTLATDVNDAACYAVANRTDCTAAPTCTFAEESQNFANWFSYYRARHLLAKTAVTRAFSTLSTSIRVTWQQLNTNINTVGEIPHTLPFEGTHREDFFSWLSTLPYNSRTPLTDAFDRAGQKFSQDSVYRKDPADSDSEMYTCRQNFHFAFTDGYWNNNSVTLGNYDNTENDLPDGTHYDTNTAQVADQAPPIYRDDNSTFLADIAMKYWATDLNGIADGVPPFVTDVDTDIDGDGDKDNYDTYWNPKNDPATWQHMVNFTVGFGVDGVNPYNDTTYQNLLDGTISWPTTGTDDQHHVDDLWHAAVNSRGRYFNASDTAELLTGFNEVLEAIDERTGSSSAVATTSSQYQTGTNLFQAVYDPSTWSGDLVAKDVITLSQQWSAAQVLARQIDGSIASARKILTFDPDNGDGIPFQWANLTADQQTALQDGGTAAEGQARLAYLRGDTTNEAKNSGTYSFRNRETALGDIVHSDPFFLPPPGAPLFFWPDDLESVTYSSFVASHSGRQDMVLFGGNDGMLHVLNATDGREILAYVPSPVIANLSELTNPSYSHQFYVDAPVQVSDVFYNGGWHTVAVGGLGKGGKGIYALDLTDPAAFLENNADSLVRWEFTDPDLGYTYTKPQIFKMNNGKWAVAIGNGYNSGEGGGDGDATLFLLDIEDGSLIKKIAAPAGIAEDLVLTGQGRSNRLTDVVALDQDQDFEVDYLYAGDLFGNLWKFDVSDANPTKWTIVKSGSTPTPLFQARDDDNNPQPITVAPAIQYHDTKNGYLLYVGTGKYVEASDPADTSIQTIYGVWDREESSGITTIVRDSLLEQEILGSNKSQFAKTNARLSTNNKMTWYDGNGLPNNSGNKKAYLGWYMDLGDTDTSTSPHTTIAQGERILDDLFVSGDRLEFITLIPSTNPCEGGGESWIFAVNAITGSRFADTTPWDYTVDGKYDTDDKVNWGGGQIWGSGINLKTPQRFRRTKLLEPGSDCQEVNLLNNSDGTITTVSGSCQGFNYGRRSWRQIQIQ